MYSLVMSLTEHVFVIVTSFVAGAGGRSIYAPWPLKLSALCPVFSRAKSSFFLEYLALDFSRCSELTRDKICEGVKYKIPQIWAACLETC